VKQVLLAKVKPVIDKIIVGIRRRTVPGKTTIALIISALRPNIIRL
jgi:hypothetical protein